MSSITPKKTLARACALMTLMAMGTSGAAVHARADRSSETTEGEAAMSQAGHDQRIDYIEFQTTNMDETKKFYIGAFGWKFTDYGPDYASFEDGRLTGGFVLAESVATGGALVILYALNLEGTETRVKAHGGTIAKKIFEFPGGRRFHFTDPSGNELAVWSDQ
jgi:predicted enzyme related to lactoylglutathione lyase